MINWQFDPAADRPRRRRRLLRHQQPRVALWKDMVISIPLDGRMFALNKATARRSGKRRSPTRAIGETLTLAPLVVKDIAIVGMAGGEYGIRGWHRRPPISRPASRSGAPTRSRRRRAGRRDLEGRQGALEARRRLDLGDRRPTIPRPTPSTRASAIPARTGMPNTGPGDNLGGERARAQPERRQDQVGLPVHAERPL